MLAVVALLVGPVLWLGRRVRGRRGAVLADGVRWPLAAMTVSAVAGFVLLVVYLLAVANLAQNYRTNAFVVQGGWLAVRMLAVVSVVAGVVLVFRVLDGRRAGRTGAALTQTGRWCLAGAVTGSAVLLVQLGYWGAFPTLG